MDAPRSNLEDVQNILQDLKKTAEGTILHGLIARGLRKFDDPRMEAAFLAFADKLLDRYLSNPLSDPGTRVRVRIIQQRLHPFLGEPIDALHIAETPPAPPVALAALPDLETPRATPPGHPAGTSCAPDGRHAHARARVGRPPAFEPCRAEKRR